MNNTIIDASKIEHTIGNSKPASENEVTEILKKSLELQGLSDQDVLKLLTVTHESLTAKIFEAAKHVKDSIYGNRLVLFAPLYISNHCQNECLYCAFRASNQTLQRKALSITEIEKETLALIAQGQKRILLVAGESHGQQGFRDVLNAIDTVYSVQHPKGNIRRLNVNIAPLTVPQFQELNKHNIGTYQLFQETYHPTLYQQLHTHGPKKNYQYRLETMDRGFQAGLEDLGIGVLFGLADWRFEVLALLSHVRHLEKTYGVGPHTISIPRIEPACGSEISHAPPHIVSDDNFKKIVAVLRLAVPYTGLILSTRETAKIRRELFDLGISQISAGSRTQPGGYQEQNEVYEAEQFSLGDTRSLSEVVADIVNEGHIPSFCTSCYRLGRVGKSFMDLAKPGLIHEHCTPNALLTFSEYLEDFGNAELKIAGLTLIKKIMEQSKFLPAFETKLRTMIDGITHGKRDFIL